MTITVWTKSRRATTGQVNDSSRAPAALRGGWGLRWKRGRGHRGVGRYSHLAPHSHSPLHKARYETQPARLFDSHEPVVSHFQRGQKKKTQQRSSSYVIRGRRWTSESPQQ